MATTATPLSPSNKTTLDQSEGSATTALYRAAIGSMNTDHYLTAFERFEAADRTGLRWNWAAALGTLNWLAYRRLWGAALAYTGALVAAALLVFGIGRLVLGLTAQTQWAWLTTLMVLAIAIPGLWGTAWFYNASRQRMAHALAANNTVPEACAMLKRNAASRARLMGLGLLNAALAAAAVVLYLNLPTAKHSPVVEAPAAPLAVATPAVQAASAPLPVASEPTLAAPEPRPVASAPVPVVDPAPVIEPAKPAKALRTKKSYLVNAGLFANASNAQHVRTTLADAGLMVIAEEVTGTKGTFTRVRVGPFATREQAVAAVLKIRSLGLEAQVLNPPPPKTPD